MIRATIKRSSRYSSYWGGTMHLGHWSVRYFLTLIWWPIQLVMFDTRWVVLEPIPRRVGRFPSGFK